MQKEPNNILFVISSLASDGAERVLAELANYFAGQGKRVKIILLTNNEVAYSIRPDVELIFLCEQIKGESRIKKIIKRYTVLRRYLKNLESDIVISFLTTVNIYTCLAAHSVGKKVIVSERNDPSRIYDAEWKHIIRNFIYRLADGYVFQTEEAKVYFKGKIYRKAKVIPNPIKTGLPEPYIGLRRKVITACGRLNAQKNYPMLLEAFARLSFQYNEYKLMIFGKGELQEDLVAYASKLGIERRVTFCGVRKDWHDLIKDASLFVMSSDYEGIPNALMEAIACGIPSISSDCPCGGPRLLIKDQVNGLLVPVGNTDHLKQAMEKVLSDRNLSDKLSRNGILIRDDYNIESISKKWMDYIFEIVNGD